jgi:hypothetical protein
MIRNKISDNKQSLILFPPAPDKISQQEFAHPSDISRSFLTEEFVFDKKNMILQPSPVRPFRFRPERVFFKHGPDPLASIFHERTRSALK